ncbi:MAG: hypothetical protein PHO43_07640, partial [Lascolabacillus sp.]|nr:hypothetical protein [Lascolabacillus sp.]
MKTKNFLLSVLLVTIPLLGFAQEWDDIYADPSQKETEKVRKYEEPEQQKKRVVIVQGDVSNMEVTANGRDIDEYNRRGNNTDTINELGYTEKSDEYTEYEYTDRIVRFHEPESSIRITGADEVIVYVGDDIYEGYNNRGWNTNIYYGMGWSSFYPWYDPWYNPWYYSRWYSPWYYGRWYDPWYYGYAGWYGGWSRWYNPWYYGGWYDPWYYGSYYGYYGGYSHGFYDGYYSSLTRNRSGRSSGIYRRSLANTSSSATAGLSGRSSTSRTATRSALSGGSTASSTRSAVSGRSSTNTTRTRIIDSSGRA